MSNFLSLSKWFYRGEGNKTLALSNPETRKVLCLQKSSVAQRDLAENLQLDFERKIKLRQQIFVPLLSEKYVKPGTIVELPQDFMAKNKDLVSCTSKKRPRCRLNKEVHEQNKFGILMQDFCFVPEIYANEVEDKMAPPTFCVEIKPKCGTLPACIQLEESPYSKVKESICKYCLFQWTKVNKEEKYPRRSGYCPLDLFSSDANRVWHALTCLLKDPQNNFKIFQDGKLMYSGETIVPSHGKLDSNSTPDKVPSNTMTGQCYPHLSNLEEVLRRSFPDHHSKSVVNHNFYGQTDGANLTSITIFLATLLQLLLRDSNPNTPDCSCCSHYQDRNHHNGYHHSFSKHPICAASQYDPDAMIGVPTHLAWKGLVFGQGGVLRKILDVQKLDSIGTDRAFHIFNEVCANGFKDDINSHIFSFNKNLMKCIDGNVCDDLSFRSKLDSLVKFLIAASANDCSIMISFQEVIGSMPKDLSCFEDVLTGKIYKYSIAIVDLDLKSSDRIAKYYKEYHDIVDNYLHFIANE